MKPKVYIETTIISYLTGRTSRDLIVAGQQQSTLDWWNNRRHQVELFTSELTVIEASGGDPQAAAARLSALNEIPLLQITESAKQLANDFVASGAIPKIATADALHVATCAMNGITYLLTWNFKHIANIFARDRILETCKQAGLVSPIFCTPDELTEVST